MKEKRTYPSEQDILNTIIDLLKIKGIPHAHVRNSGNIVHRGSMTFFGKTKNQRGVADILAVHKGHAIAIEVKSEKGVIRPEQVEWLSNWQKAGGVYIVARQLEHVDDFINSL